CIFWLSVASLWGFCSVRNNGKKDCEESVMQDPFDDFYEKPYEHQRPDPEPETYRYPLDEPVERSLSFQYHFDEPAARSLGQEYRSQGSEAAGEVGGEADMYGYRSHGQDFSQYQQPEQNPYKYQPYDPRQNQGDQGK